MIGAVDWLFYDSSPDLEVSELRDAERFAWTIHAPLSLVGRAGFGCSHKWGLRKTTGGNREGGLSWDRKIRGSFDGPTSALLDALGMVGQAAVDELEESVGFPGLVKTATSVRTAVMPESNSRRKKPPLAGGGAIARYIGVPLVATPAARGDGNTVGENNVVEVHLREMERSKVAPSAAFTRRLRWTSRPTTTPVTTVPLRRSRVLLA